MSRIGAAMEATDMTSRSIVRAYTVLAGLGGTWVRLARW